MFIVFDMDGTLTNVEHRVHYLQQHPKDWDAFYDACDQDPPNFPIVEVFRAAVTSPNLRFEIWTGRPERLREKTEQWLQQQGLWLVHVRMRDDGDHRPDTDVKAQWLIEAGHPDLVFEDRKSVVDMYRSYGITCVQVAPGDF